MQPNIQAENHRLRRRTGGLQSCTWYAVMEYGWFYIRTSRKHKRYICKGRFSVFYSGILQPPQAQVWVIVCCELLQFSTPTHSGDVVNVLHMTKFYLHSTPLCVVLANWGWWVSKQYLCNQRGTRASASCCSSLKVPLSESSVHWKVAHVPLCIYNFNNSECFCLNEQYSTFIVCCLPGWHTHTHPPTLMCSFSIHRAELCYTQAGVSLEIQFPDKLSQLQCEGKWLTFIIYISQHSVQPCLHPKGQSRSPDLHHRPKPVSSSY